MQSHMGIPPMPPRAQRARAWPAPIRMGGILVRAGHVTAIDAPLVLRFGHIVYVSTQGLHGIPPGHQVPFVTSSPVRFGFRPESYALPGPHDRFRCDPWLPPKPTSSAV